MVSLVEDILGEGIRLRHSLGLVDLQSEILRALKAGQVFGL